MIRLLVLALAALGAFVLVRWFFSMPRGSGPKCVGCIHCRRLFPDGVMCGFRDKEVFKNPAQVDMCPDFTRRG